MDFLPLLRVIFGGSVRLLSNSWIEFGLVKGGPASTVA